MTSTNGVCLRRGDAILKLTCNEFAGIRCEHHTVTLVGRAVFGNAIAAALMSNHAHLLAVGAILRCVGQLRIREQGTHGGSVQGSLLYLPSIVVLGLPEVLCTAVLRIIKGFRN